MVERHIRLNATEDVKEFVNEATKCDFDIDISYNRIIIDAKSLLGILSMDLTRELTVRCYGESQRFNEVIFRERVCAFLCNKILSWLYEWQHFYRRQENDGKTGNPYFGS